MGANRSGSFPYEPGRSATSRLYGIWDTRSGEWAERPAFSRDEAYERAAAMIDAYAAGYADAVMARVRSNAGWRTIRK